MNDHILLTRPPKTGRFSSILYLRVVAMTFYNHAFVTLFFRVFILIFQVFKLLFFHVLILLSTLNVKPASIG